MVSKEELSAFIDAVFPGNRCAIDEVVPMGATVSLAIGPAELRPGNTVAGPALMMLADLALYVAILGEVGIVPLAVTTNLTINFLRKPAGSGRIVAVCKLLKVGRTMAIGEVSLYSEHEPNPVAHAVGTYAIPAQNP